MQSVTDNKAIPSTVVNQLWIVKKVHNEGTRSSSPIMANLCESAVWPVGAGCYFWASLEDPVHVHLNPVAPGLEVLLLLLLDPLSGNP